MNQTELCGICRENLELNTKSLDCKHTFHTECIDQWTARVSSCPFCREPVNTGRVIDPHVFDAEFSSDEISLMIDSGEITVAEFCRMVRDAEVGSDTVYERIISGYIDDYDIITEFILDGHVSRHHITRLVFMGFVCESDLLNMTLHHTFSKADVIGFVSSGLISPHTVNLLMSTGILTKHDINSITESHTTLSDRIRTMVTQGQILLRN